MPSSARKVEVIQLTGLNDDATKFDSGPSSHLTTGNHISTSGHTSACFVDFIAESNILPFKHHKPSQQTPTSEIYDKNQNKTVYFGEET